MDDKLKKALLWIYVAQYVKTEGVDIAAGILEDDCKRHCPEYGSLLELGFIEKRREKDRPYLLRTTVKGKEEAEIIVNEILLRQNHKLQNILKEIPLRLLIFFVKEIFPSNDGLHMYEASSYTYGKGAQPRQKGELRWPHTCLSNPITGDEHNIHLCLLNDERIKEKRDTFLDKLAELGLVVKDIETYRFADMIKRGSVYVIAPELMQYLKDHASQTFKEELFDNFLEKHHMLFHNFEVLLEKSKEERLRFLESEDLIELSETFENVCQSLLQNGVISLLQDGSYYYTGKAYKGDTRYSERKRGWYEEKMSSEKVLFLRPLVEHLLEGPNPPPEVILHSISKCNRCDFKGRFVAQAFSGPCVN